MKDRKRRKFKTPRSLWVLFLGFPLAALGSLVFEDWLTKDPPPAPGYNLVTLRELGGFQVFGPLPATNALSTDPGLRPNRKPTPTVFPVAIQALNDTEVVVPGFMLPYNLDRRGKVSSFYLIRSTMVCCFGQPPRLNEIVRCETVAGHPVEFMDNLPVRVYGRLMVGDVLQDGQVQALYRLKVERVERLRHPDQTLQYLPRATGGAIRAS
jgi:hypothetical protein